MCPEPVVRKSSPSSPGVCPLAAVLMGMSHMWARLSKSDEGESLKKNVWWTTPKTGSTSQNYYSIHAQPDLNSLDFSIYLLSIGPSCTKNTMACLTFGTFCHCLCTAGLYTEVFCRWFHAKETNGFVCFLKIWIYSDSLLESTIFLFLIYLGL